MDPSQDASNQTTRLVRLAQGGDDGALEQLYTRIYPRVERIVRARLGPKLRALVEAEDVLAETFFQMLLCLTDFEPRSDATFIDWISTIAVNQIRKDAQRWAREKRDPKRLVRIDPSADSAAARRVREITAKIAGPRTGALREERARLIEEALDELDEAHREVLVFRHFAGMTFEEIALRIDRKTEAAAREFYRRARAKLAVALRRRGVDEPD